jgi:hypothetical protein
MISFFVYNLFLSSIDSFIKLLIEHRHSGLEPLFLNERGLITVKPLYMSNPDTVFTLFDIEGLNVAISPRTYSIVFVF